MSKSKSCPSPEVHALPLSAMDSVFNTNSKTGLSRAEVVKRIDIYGLNQLPKADGPSLLERVLRELRNPMVMILLVALVFTTYLGELSDSIVVALAIIINVSIALYQEGKAKNIFEALSKQQATRARVLRDSSDVVIPSEEIVPGDIVFVSSGEAVPADLRLIRIDGATADEAVLTGEWEPVEKQLLPVAKNTSLAERTNMLFSGTLLSAGSAVGVAVQTGVNTEFGKLAIETADEELTPLQKQLQKLAYVLSGIVIALSAVILVIGLLRDLPFGEIMLLSIAIAVSAIPEGLPGAITAILAVGMRHVLEKDGLVKSLLAAETLGATDVIISDKTGTLTEGKMSLVSLLPANSTDVPATDHVTSLSADQDLLLRSALLCSDGYITVDPETGQEVANGRPVEKALVEAGMRLGLNRNDLNNDDEELDFLPFASERRYAAVLVEGVHGHYAILSGAPEYMVTHATYYFTGEGDKPALLSDDYRAKLTKVQTELAARGHRLTGVARIKIEAHKFDELDGKDMLDDFGKDLEFMGYIGFSDPVRGDVPKSIRVAQEAGARVLVATGDNRNTALAIAKQAGVSTNNKVIEGRELIDLSDDEIYELFKSTSVFARMRPTQKKRLSSILQRYGHVVAMTGDGVNDAPALASADVGIAVHSGTDVAKSAADLILLKNSFSTIVAAIQEGRRLLDNIRRVVVHRISAGFGEILIVISSLLLAAPVPILPKQILWINIIQGGLLTFAYAFEPADAHVMKRSPNEAGKKGILNTQVKKLLVLSSVSFGLVSLSIYLLSYFGVFTISFEHLRTLIFAILTIDVMVFSFALKDFDQPIWKINIFSNKVLVVAVLMSASAFAASMLVPVLRDFLSLSPLPLTLWGVIFVVACLDLTLVELAKRVSRPKIVSNTA